MVLLWVAVATFADTRFKSAGSFWTRDFLIGTTCYCLTSVIALAAFRRQSWGWIILVWNILSLALSLLLSVTLYHEPFTRYRLVAALMLLGAFLLVGGSD
jgi:drug/metabolite transporter (DMT)-like permease